MVTHGGDNGQGGHAETAAGTVPGASAEEAAGTVPGGSAEEVAGAVPGASAKEVAGTVPGGSGRETGEWVARAVADAAAAVPGVAFLRPRLSDLLRGSAAAAGRRRTPAGDRSPAGVRARRDPGTACWRVEVQLTVWHGHRAVDVAREVRAAGERAVAGTPVEIAVTVAGIA